jgi:serine/threonine-protein kinase PknG
MNCTRAGCGGQIVGGYCDLCGMKPAESVSAPPSAAGSGPPPSELTAAASSVTRRSGTGRSRTAARHRLGAGLVEVPPTPYLDPDDAVLKDPQVPENRRFCAHCEEPVGRGRDGQPGRTSGFCRKCGAAFSFDPKLAPGELVGRQYEVVGCLAHGGMGWIYLAKDRNVSDKRVVLKGLLNAGDPDATAAALAEREFLAKVEHPNIVNIINFVQHDTAGYIVMEYVGGQSLKQILAARREANGGQPDPLPPAHAIAYMLEVLPAFGYLHDLGLLFCDFKLDNVIQTQHSLKLIDLGGVYRIDGPTSAVFGTVGYQAPEIASLGPSVPSDLFTIARTLAVLCMDFRAYQGTYRFRLPEPDTVPLFQRHDSLYRVLLKATAPHPDDRFQSAEEFADQLYGVLREIVADEESHPVPGSSTLFTEAYRAPVERADWRILPRPQAESDDPSAGYLAAITSHDPEQVINQLLAVPDRTVEVELRLAAARIEAGELDEAERVLQEVADRDPWEWRAAWYRGLAALAREDGHGATEHLRSVYAAIPGELAPKLALGVAYELHGDPQQAVRWYEIVARTDPTITSASFGLARCQLSLGHRAAAVSAYEQVPDSSSGYVDAQVARIRVLSTGNGAGQPTMDELVAAASTLEGLAVDGEQRDHLTASILGAALGLALSGGGSGSTNLLGHTVAERDLRLGLERCYRSLARRAPTRAERIRLVDQANRTRPRTWV